jgi:hypothetical protein
VLDSTLAARKARVEASSSTMAMSNTGMYCISSAPLKLQVFLGSNHT